MVERPAPADDALELVVGDRIYTGWTEMRITRAIDRMASDFEIQVSERWATQGLPWQILPWQPCQIRLRDGTLLLTGFIDGVAPSIAASQHKVKITGRSKTEDLIDCMSEIEGGEFRNAKLDAIARAMCARHSIEVVVETDVGDAFDVATYQRTETGFRFLERLGRLRGVLLTDDPQGRLVLTRAGELRAQATIAEGENVLAAEGRIDTTKRYSKYIVKTQRGIGASRSRYADVVGEGPSTGGAVQTGIFAFYEDPSVPRYRPHVTLAEKALTQAEAVERARWQAAYAAARSIAAKVTVPGWRTNDGTPWMSNRQVPVTIPLLRLDQDMLVASVSYGLSNTGGRVTEMELGPVEGYTPDPGQVRRRRQPGGGANPWAALGVRQ